MKKPQISDEETVRKNLRMKRTREAFDLGCDVDNDEDYDGDGSNEYDYDDGFTERDPEHESDIHDDEQQASVNGQDNENAQGSEEKAQDLATDSTYDDSDWRPRDEPDTGAHEIDTDMSSGSLILPPPQSKSSSSSSSSRSCSSSSSSGFRDRSTALVPLSALSVVRNNPFQPPTIHGRPSSSAPRVKVEAKEREVKSNSPTSNVIDLLGNFQLSETATTESPVKSVPKPKPKQTRRVRQQGQKGIVVSNSKTSFPHIADGYFSTL